MSKKKFQSIIKNKFLAAEEAHHDILSSNILQQKVKFLDKNISQKKLKRKCLNTELAYDLDLEGKIKSKYSRNGKNILMFSENKLTSVETKTFNVHFELDLDLINDAIYLHNELYVSVAQKNNVFIYNKDGVELHSIREQCNRLEFLPYHFLMVRIGNDPFLKYQDTSTGKLVSTLYVGQKNCDVMTQNKNNGIIHLGNTDGTVTLWSPNSKNYLMKILCHSSKILQLKIQNDFLFTLGLDKRIKLWDTRNIYKPMGMIKLKENCNKMDVSQTNLIALGYKNYLKIFKNPNFASKEEDCEYLSHKFHSTQIQDLQFWPYEDILTVGYTNGLSNLIVPGSGDPNFDFYEESPYQTKNERKEKEIISLLEKIPPEMINLDLPYEIENENICIKNIKKEPKNVIRNALSRFITKK